MSNITTDELHNLLAHDDDYLTSNALEIINNLGGIRQILEISLQNLAKPNDQQSSGQIQNENPVTSHIQKTKTNINSNSPSTTPPPVAISHAQLEMNAIEQSARKSTIEQPISQSQSRSRQHTTIGIRLPQNTIATSDDYNSNNINDTKFEFEIVAYPDNDILHKIFEIGFENKTDLADRISSGLLRSRIMLGCILPCFFIISISVQALFIISAYFTSYFDNNNQSIPVGILVTQYMYIFISAIVFIFIILSFDWIIFKHQCSSFDTIYKIYNAILMEISFAFRVNYAAVQFIPELCVFVLMMICLVCNDAWNISLKWRLSFVTMITIILTGWYLSILFESNSGDKIVNFWGFDISLRDVNLNAQANVCIFLYKQVFFMIKDPQKATAVNERPKIVWAR